MTWRRNTSCALPRNSEGFAEAASERHQLIEARRLLHDARQGRVEIRNGFIVGIFNYCDRWCDRCAFTSRCRLFADVAEIEASFDPGMKALVDMPLLGLEPPPPPPAWLEELFREMDEAIRQPADEESVPEPSLPREHETIEERAHRYRSRVHAWFQARELSAVDPTDPRAVVLWFHTFIAARVHRALHGLAGDRPEARDWPPDYDGSAKVALLGIDRSHAAWPELAERGMATAADVAPFIAELAWLGEALERVFPNARTFMRPGLDEPDEVWRLYADERRRA